MLKVSLAAETISSDNVHVLHDKGTALVNLNQLSEALEVFESIVKVAPDDLVAWLSINTTAAELSRFPEALAANDRALEIAPGKAIVWANRAALLGGGFGRYEDALHAAEIALGLEPGFLPALSAKGSSLHDLRRYREAVAVFEEVAEILDDIPDDSREYHNLREMQAGSWFNLGQSLVCDGRLTDALAAYERALSIQTYHKPSAFGKLMVLMQLGRANDAREFARQVSARFEAMPNSEKAAG
jgi:tetratricopeptide (TPR) repeat protein